MLVETKTYYVKYKDEPEIKVTNLSEFCRQHALSPTKMCSVAGGVLPGYRGWTARKEVARATLQTLG
jgi:hypothetical protein